MKIVGLDFETANTKETSICAAAVATFEDGILTESLYWLVRPPKGSGFFQFTYCHDLTWFDVKDALEFSGIAAELLDRLTAADVVVAHNVPFDIRHLRATLHHFQITPSPFAYLCTWQMAKRVWPNLKRHGLDAVAAHIGRTFRHHNAKDDAETAGHALLAMMAHTGSAGPAEFAAATNISFSTFTEE